MKIKTYNCRDMRSALRQVREEQGPDAVILSTRHLAGGVEVTVAVDPDAGASAQPQAAAPARDGEFAQLLARAAAAKAPAPKPAAPSAEQLLGAELRSMRHLLEHQLSQLAWNDLTRRAPETAELL